MELFFSIIIPTLNEEKLIPRLLRNLSIQKEKNFEVIVVDAFSKDKTKNKVLEFKNNFPLFKEQFTALLND